MVFQSLYASNEKVPNFFSNSLPESSWDWQAQWIIIWNVFFLFSIKNASHTFNFTFSTLRLKNACSSSKDRQPRQALRLLFFFCLHLYNPQAIICNIHRALKLFMIFFMKFYDNLRSYQIIASKYRIGAFILRVGYRVIGPLIKCSSEEIFCFVTSESDSET